MRTFFGVVLLLALALGLTACATAASQGPAWNRPAPTSEEVIRQLGLTPSADARVNEGGYPPARELLHDLNGRPASLAIYSGHPLLLDFFTTYAAPSQLQMKLYQSLADQYAARGLAVAGISLDLNGTEIVRLFASELGISYPIYIAEGEWKEGKTPYGFIQEVPTCLLIDGQGRLVKAYKGLVKREVMERDLAALLRRK